LSLDLLKGFEAAARHLSFTRAAEELFLTQSAISREIKTLEEQLGRPLFDRVNRGLRLTDAGRMLYRAVGEALTLIEEATDHLSLSKAAETLTVTTSVPLASMWLVPKLPRFFRRHPDIEVRCVAADQKLDLDRERLDVAIRWAPPGSGIVGGLALFEVEIFPVCSPRVSRGQSRHLKKPADLNQHVLLDLDTVTGSGRWSDWAPWLAAKKLRDLKPAGTLRFSHYDQVIQAAMDDSGIAIGRSPHSIRHLRDGLLIAPFGEEGKLSFGTYFALVSRRATGRPVVEKFVTWLREEIQMDGKTERTRNKSGARRR
jgi:DNA-binding transcriptional LysR family regulator